MAALSQGDRDAFEPLFRALYPRAVALACLRLDAVDAEDAAQAALERVFARANRFLPGRPALPWFYAIAANEVHALARRRGKERVRLREASAATDLPSDANPEQDLVISELRAALLRALDELDEPSREAIHALLGEAPPPSTTGAALRKRVSRAYARLRIFDGRHVMSIDLAARVEGQARRASRRAYEQARWRMALLHGAALCGFVAVVAWLTVGTSTWVWLPLTFAVWTVVTWRGSAMLRGARLGVAAGLITLLVPAAWLQTCCTPGAGMVLGCCSMPFACTGVGILLGLPLALLLPHGVGARKLESAAGMLLGVLGVATLRCAGLFLGEALGLLGGFVGGVLAAAAARALLDQQRRASGRGRL